MIDGAVSRVVKNDNGTSIIYELVMRLVTKQPNPMNVVRVGFMSLSVKI
jgi:hypothetical protein